LRPGAPSWMHRRTAPAPGRRATRRTSSAQIAQSLRAVAARRIE
jgi:hypothetical protein